MDAEIPLKQSKFKCVVISDTHGDHARLIIPPCDFLFHTGDWTNFGDVWEVAKFGEWIKQQPARHKVVIAGNHDRSAQNSPHFIRDTFKDLCVHYLSCEQITLDGVRIWGAPYTPEFNNWAFNMKRENLHLIWEMIPDNLHVLLTHGPPHQILDESHHEGRLRYVGDEALLEAVKLKRPLYHAFGHIHGIWNHVPAWRHGTTFINAANRPTPYYGGDLFEPIEFEIDLTKNP